MKNSILLENARQKVNDLYRNFPEGVVHFDYEAKTARVSTHDVMENILIFGEDFTIFSKLARGAKKCETQKILERMKNVKVA